MNKQSLARWAIFTLALLTYFFIAILLTGEAYTSVGVLFLILVIWFLIYKLRYKSLGEPRAYYEEYADFTGTLERIKERVAEDEARRRTAADRESQVLMERERRKADRRKEASTGDKKYADSIERRVREAKTNQDQTEGTNEVES
jgi:Ca2+/Na+ antiporter